MSADKSRKSWEEMRKNKNFADENNNMSFEEIKEILPDVDTEEKFRIYTITSLKSLRKEIKILNEKVDNLDGKLEKVCESISEEISIIKKQQDEIQSKCKACEAANQKEHKLYFKLMIWALGVVISLLGAAFYSMKK
jgi:DNA-binding transcriptional MerR regulator